jgi:uncharacterized membrane protein YkvA (DUF1232 family)
MSKPDVSDETNPLQGLNEKEYSLLNRVVKDADSDDEKKVIDEIPSKLASAERKNRGGVLTEFLANVRLLYEMLRDGSYSISWKTKALLIGALVYFIMPVDATPDFIPFIGYIDDSVVISAVIKFLKDEIDDYKEHRRLS